MDFGQAVQALKDGKRVAREGWNGKGMYLYLERFPHLPGHTTPFEPCVVMFTADKKYQPGWLSSQADMLAEDWTVIP